MQCHRYPSYPSLLSRLSLKICLCVIMDAQTAVSSRTGAVKSSIAHPIHLDSLLPLRSGLIGGTCSVPQHVNHQSRADNIKHSTPTRLRSGTIGASSVGQRWVGVSLVRVPGWCRSSELGRSAAPPAERRRAAVGPPRRASRAGRSPSRPHCCRARDCDTGCASGAAIRQREQAPTAE